MAQVETWHLFFDATKFSQNDVAAFTKGILADGDFGGYPIQRLDFYHATSELLFLTFVFTAPAPPKRALREQMAKYLYARMLHPEKLDTKQYYDVINQSIEDLGIEFYEYPDDTLDIMYWGQATHGN